jgi:hypothetical protein
MTKTNPIETHPTEYEQGRRARLAGINKLDAPYDTDTDALKAWTAGFDGADGEAARDETSAPDGSGAKAGSQISMVAGANKAKAE